MPGAKPKLPTIRDVAARAGVSKSLVSLVMRNAPNVSDARRTAVLEAAAELGYRPNAVARSLVQSRSGVLGCVLSDLHNPFFADVADGIEEAAVDLGYRALLSSAFLDASRESIAVDTLLQLRVDGLVLLGTMTDADHFEAAGRSVPVVLVGKQTDSELMDCIGGDDAAGAAMVVRHLVEMGHRRITHISGGGGAGAPERQSGYERAMRAHGLDDEVRVVGGAFTEAGGASAMAQLLQGDDRPTAVFAPNDFAALGALDVLDEARIRVPDDISLAGYDGLAMSRIRRIDLTTVRQPSLELGRRAVELLIERLDGGRTEARHVVVTPELVIGSTTGPPR